MCATNPCVNDGQCVDKPDGGFECICKSGYSGSTCDGRLFYSLNFVSISLKISNFYLRNKTFFPCLHSLVKTEANVWENSQLFVVVTKKFICILQFHS